MGKRKGRVVAAGALAASMVVMGVMGCRGSGDAGGQASGRAEGMGGPVANAPLGGLVGTWTVTELGGQDVSALKGMGERRPNLVFSEDGKLAGFAGVNRFAGAIDPAAAARGEFTTTGGIAATKMAGPPEAMSLEQRVLDVLGRAERFGVKGDTLTLAQGESALARFARQR